MPKLSQQTLEKRFKCPHCGESIRSRQGLSGHIQFKHPAGTTETGNKSRINILAEAIIKRRLDADLLELSREEFRELAEIQADWYFFKKFAGQLNIKLNDTDYKAYLLVATALMYGNQRLVNKLKKELSSVTGLLMEISYKMGSKS